MLQPNIGVQGFFGLNPGVQVSDPAESNLADEVAAAQAERNKLRRPAAPTIINTIRGNRMGQEIPYFEWAAQRQWDNSNDRVLAAQAALNQYQDNRTNQNLRTTAVNAEAERNRSEAAKNNLGAEVFRNPDMARHDLLRSGVDPVAAEQAYPRGTTQSASPGSLYNAQTITPTLKQTSNQFLQQFFDPNSPSYQSTQGMNAADVFDKVSKMAGPEAMDPKSELARVIMSGMNQRFPEGFGQIPPDPDTFGVFPFNKMGMATPGFNQYVAGPILSMTTMGREPTWNWRQSYQRSKALEDFIRSFNMRHLQKQPSRPIGVPSIGQPQLQGP